MRLLVLLCALLFATPIHAATLLWESQPSTGPLTVERSATATGPFDTIATVPAGTLSFVLTPGAYGWYRIGSPAGPSNVVQFSLDVFTGPMTLRLDEIEADWAAMVETWNVLERRIVALETVPILPPPPVGPITTRLLDPTHLEIACVGSAMRTTGSGLRRVVECVP